VKCNPKHRTKHGTDTGAAEDLSDGQRKAINRLCKRANRYSDSGNRSR
jgi:hypothetical protein